MFIFILILLFIFFLYITLLLGTINTTLLNKEKEEEIYKEEKCPNCNNRGFIKYNSFFQKEYCTCEKGVTLKWREEMNM